MNSSEAFRFYSPTKGDLQGMFIPAQWHHLFLRLNNRQIFKIWNYFRQYDLTDFFRLLQSSGTSFGSDQATGTGIGRRDFHKKFIEDGKLGWLNNEHDAQKGKIRADHLQWTESFRRYENISFLSHMKLVESWDFVVVIATHRWHFNVIQLFKLSRSAFKTFFIFDLVNDLLWPSWHKFNTVHLKFTEMKDYMRKIFTNRIENSPRNVPWVFYGVQGVAASYVSICQFVSHEQPMIRDDGKIL